MGRYLFFLLFLVFFLNRINAQRPTSNRLFTENNLFGYEDTLGNRITDAKYDDVQRFFEEDRTAVKKNGKWAVMDENGVELTGFDYDLLFPYHGSLAKAKKGKQFGFLDLSGKEQIIFQFDNAGDFFMECARVKQKDSWGFIDTTGNFIFPCQWDYADDFRDSITSVGNNGKYGFVDRNGKTITECRYDQVRNFSGAGTTKVGLNNKIGMINRDGVEIIVPEYNEIISGGSGYLLLKKDGVMGLWTDDGKMLTPCLYTKFSFNYSKTIWAQKDDLWGLLDSMGTPLTKFRYESFDGFGGYYGELHNASVKVNGKYGLLSPNGLEVTEMKYSDAVYFINYDQGKYAVVNVAGVYGIIDRNGKEVLPCSYSNVQQIDDSEDFTLFSNDKMGFFSQGKRKLDANYSGILKEGQGYLLSIDGKYGYADTSATEIVPCMYDSLTAYQGSVWVLTQGKWGVYKGEKTILKYDALYHLKPESFSYFTVKMNDLLGVADSTGKKIIEANYTDIRPIVGTTLMGKRDNKWDIIWLDNGKPEEIQADTIFPGFPYYYESSYTDSEGELSENEKEQIQEEKRQRKRNEFYVINSAGFFAIINNEGKRVTDLIYEMTFEEATFGMLGVQRNEKWGFVNVQTGEESVPCRYTSVNKYSNENYMKLPTSWIVSDADESFEIDDRNRRLYNLYDLSMIKKDGLYGLYPESYYEDESIAPVIAPEYKSISVLDELDGQGAIVNKQGNYGVIDQRGIAIIPFEFSSIRFDNEYYETGVFFVRKGKMEGVYNNYGKLLVPAEYSYVSQSEDLTYYETPVFLTNRNGKYGLYDYHGHEVVVPEYDELLPLFVYSSNLFVCKKGKKYGYLNNKFKLVLPCEYDFVETDFEDIFGKIMKGGKYGLFSQQNFQIIQCKYQEVDFVSENRVAVKLNGKWGYLDLTGNEIVPFIYDYTDYFSEGIALVEKGGGIMYIDTLGKQINNFIYESGTSFGEGYAIVRRQGAFGYLLADGKESIFPQYQEANLFRENLARVKKNGKFGFINSNNKVQIAFLYDAASDCSGGRISACKEGKWGIINADGTTSVSFLYDALFYIRSYGYTPVKQGNKWGIIDDYGNQLVPCEYDEVATMSDGRTKVVSGKKQGMVNDSNIVVVPIEFDELYDFTEGLAGARVGKKWGFIDTSGKFVIQPIYKGVFQFRDGNAYVTEKRKSFYINKSGEKK